MLDASTASPHSPLPKRRRGAGASSVASAGVAGGTNSAVSIGEYFCLVYV